MEQKIELTVEGEGTKWIYLKGTLKDGRSMSERIPLHVLKMEKERQQFFMEELCRNLKKKLSRLRNI